MDSNIGKIYGCYKLVGIAEERAKDGHLKYVGECVYCGEKIIKRLIDFKVTIGNKCYHYTQNGIKIFPFFNQRLLNVWTNMCHRCYNEHSDDYRFYGANGIRICEEWKENSLLFKEWALANGYKNNLTIDRIDPSKDYCPENCRWISAKENSRFKSTTNMIEVDGVVKSGRQWADFLKIGTNRINTYIREKGLDYTKEFIKQRMEFI